MHEPAIARDRFSLRGEGVEGMVGTLNFFMRRLGRSIFCLPKEKNIRIIRHIEKDI